MSDGPDIVIIGSGIGGATIAAALAPSGRRIVILERGERLADSAEARDADAIFARGHFRPKEEWVTPGGEAFNPGNYYYVGGAPMILIETGVADLGVDIAGFTENARLVRAILEGERGHRRDIVLVNAAAGLMAAGVVAHPLAGMEKAMESIDSGGARGVLQKLQKNFPVS